MFSIDFEKYKVIDISREVIPFQNPERPFEIKKGFLQDGTYKYDILCTNTHVGTHIEAEAHFYENGKTIDKYSLDAFWGRGILLPINLPAEQELISREYVEEQIDELCKMGDIVVCRSENPEYIKYFSYEATEYFRDKKIKMLVIGEGTGIKAGKDNEHIWKFHDTLLGNGITLMEIVANLNEISKKEFFVIAFPFLVRGIDSSWCRTVIVEAI